MIRRITLHNFMAHKQTVIEPAEGLTVLAGPNNCGKSAVVEALQVLATNSGKDFMTRHGEKECRIIVETSDDHVIEWRRKSSTVSYHLDGRPVHRMRGAVPDDLDALLKLPQVVGLDGKESFAVHFGTQKDPIFLLDCSGRHTATFFASFSDASRLVAMQAAHKKKVNDRRADERMFAGREEQLSRSLETLQPVPDLVVSLGVLEETHRTLQGEIAGIRALEMALSALQRQAQEVFQASERAAVLSDLPAPPSIAETLPLEQLLDRIHLVDITIVRETLRSGAIASLEDPPILVETLHLQNLCRDLARQENSVLTQQARVHSLGPLSSPPPVEAVEPLGELCSHFEYQIERVDFLRARAGAVQDIPALPSLFDLGALLDTVQSLREATVAAAEAKARAVALTDMPEPLELADFTSLARLVMTLSDVQAAAADATAKLKQADTGLVETQEQIGKWASAHPICPTCGGPINPDQFLAEGRHDHAP